MKNQIDLDTKTSDHRGLSGIFEWTLRNFKVAMHLIMLMPLYALGAVVIGTCLVPGISLFQKISELTANQTAIVQYFGHGFSIAAGYFLYGFSLIFVIPCINFLLRIRLKEWRGPYYSLESFKWYIHNGLTYLVRFTFLEFITPTPFSLYFYQMMGMKIGKGTIINSTWISDPSLIEMGKKVTIGGSVTIVAHYGQGGMLIIAPVKIGDECTIGIKSTIMGGSVIGERAKVLPHSVVMPKTIIPAGELWGGVPARKIGASLSESVVENNTLSVAKKSS
ncbi:MAG TPA: hypothetical protein VN132_10135 [Bdellovibrio sp.]|nr:hypothetical protein [Bdellovibrio sp.]